jgi:hypothetical protein
MLWRDTGFRNLGHECDGLVLSGVPAAFGSEGIDLTSAAGWRTVRPGGGRVPDPGNRSRVRGAGHRGARLRLWFEAC